MKSFCLIAVIASVAAIQISEEPWKVTPPPAVDPVLDALEWCPDSDRATLKDGKTHAIANPAPGFNCKNQGNRL